MVRYLAGRVAQAGGVLVAALCLVFFVGHVIGDPIDLMLSPEAPAEVRESLRRSLGFDRSLTEQFFDFIQRIRSGFGDSLWQRQPALTLALERVPVTLYLAGTAVLIAFPTALVLGAWAALRPGTSADRAINVFSLGGVSIVDYWLGLMLVLIFAVSLGWLPTGGYGAGAYVVLPAVTLAYRTIGRLSQLTRSALIEEYNRPYVDVLRAKGLSEFRVFTHTMKNAAVPIITLAGDEIVTLANGALIVETVFAWPGLGRLLLQAIAQRDLFLVEAAVFVIAVIVIVGNLLVDIAYTYLDPKIRLA